jgi:hypothetical protein
MYLSGNASQSNSQTEKGLSRTCCPINLMCVGCLSIPESEGFHRPCTSLGIFRYHKTTRHSASNRSASRDVLVAGNSSHDSKTTRKSNNVNLEIKLGHPLLISIYSFSLLLVGCAAGSYWHPKPSMAIGIAITGALCMSMHDTLVSIAWIAIAAKWARQTARAVESKRR